MYVKAAGRPICRKNINEGEKDEKIRFTSAMLLICILLASLMSIGVYAEDECSHEACSHDSAVAILPTLPGFSSLLATKFQEISPAAACDHPYGWSMRLLYHERHNSYCIATEQYYCRFCNHIAWTDYERTFVPCPH